MTDQAIKPAGDHLDIADVERRIKAIFIGSIGNLVEYARSSRRVGNRRIGSAGVDSSDRLARDSSARRGADDFPGWSHCAGRTAARDPEATAGHDYARLASGNAEVRDQSSDAFHRRICRPTSATTSTRTAPDGAECGARPVGKAIRRLNSA